MNNLSILLWLSGVTESLSHFIILISVLAIVITICSIAVLLIRKCILIEENKKYYSHKNKDNEVEQKDPLVSLAKAVLCFSLPISIIFVVIGNVLPNQKTMMMIAASEAGQRVIESPRVQGVVDPSVEFLKTWIEKATEDMKKEKNK